LFYFYYSEFAKEHARLVEENRIAAMKFDAEAKECLAEKAIRDAEEALRPAARFDRGDGIDIQRTDHPPPDHTRFDAVARIQCFRRADDHGELAHGDEELHPLAREGRTRIEPGTVIRVGRGGYARVVVDNVCCELDAAVFSGQLDPVQHGRVLSAGVIALMR